MPTVALLTVLLLVLAGCTPRSRRVEPLATCSALTVADSLPADTVVYDTLAVTTRPQRISSPPVRYPDAAREAGIGDRVVFDVTISAAGRAEPGSERLVSAHYREFATTALEVLRKSQFCPGTLHGRAVRVRIRIPINFSIARAGGGA